MKNIFRLSSLAFIAVLAFACNDADRNIEDGKYFDDPNKDHEVVIQEGVVKLDNKYLDWARKFPGLVPDSIYRYVNGIDVTIDMNFSRTSSTFRHSAHYARGLRPYFSTGFYAPPAEVITVTRPAGSPNVEIIIGLSDGLDGLVGKDKKLDRYPNINRRMEFPTGVDEIEIYNYFGGPIFVRPLSSHLGTTGVQTYTFKGVVKPANFVKGETNINDWFNQLDTVEVPMIEVITDRVIWQMPLKDARTAKANGGLNRENFQALLDWYDDVIVHDFFDYVGANEIDGDIDQAPQFKIRCMADIQISAGAAHAGYPAMFGGSSYSVRGMQYDMMRTGNAWGFFHEIGHNFQQAAWMWGSGGGHDVDLEGMHGINEVSNNFHIYHSFTRLTGEWQDPNGYFNKAAVDFAAAPDDGYKNFGLSEVDITFTPLAVPINANNARITPFMQLAQRYGWRFYAYLAKDIRRLSEDDHKKITKDSEGSDDQAATRRAYFILRACEYAQTDLRPFFNDWGMKYPRGVGKEIDTKLPNKLDTADKWWHSFDYSIIPSFEDKDMTGAIILDNTPIWTSISGDLPRVDWTVVDHSKLYADAATGNILPHLFDNSGTTYLALVKPGKTIGGISQPAGSTAFFTVDLGAVAQEYNYFNYMNRTNNATVGLRVKAISLHGSDDNVTFTPIGSRVTLDTANLKMQKFPLGVDYTYRYIKVIIEDFDSAQGSTMQVAEFGLGFDDV